MIAVSSHGFKMIGVGELVSVELLGDKVRAARTAPLLALRGSIRVDSYLAGIDLRF